jgi:hypothetical protein
MNDKELTRCAREAAKNLSYNEDPPQALAKHLLLEMAHRIDKNETGVQRRYGRLTVVNGLGMFRYMNWKEKLKFVLFGTIPKRV